MQHYKEKHVNPWHEINEEQLKEIYIKLIHSMDINDEFSFCYFMNYIIKRLSGTEDAHTIFDSINIIPMNFRIFGSDVLINYPNALRGNKLIAINGKRIEAILREIDDVVTYGTNGKKIYEYEKALFNKNILFGLPSLRNAESLTFEIQKPDGVTIHKRFFKHEKMDSVITFDMQKYKYGNIASYYFEDNCLIYNHRSIQKKFENMIIQTIEKLEKEDLSSIDTIIIDIRGNTGGYSKLNDYLIQFLKKHSDKKLICLTDYRVFSGGRYALISLMKLGAITIGEEISTPLNCYGNCNWIQVDGYYFSSSESYLHPLMGWSASSKEEYNKEMTNELNAPIIFSPDVLINEDENDYLNNIDTILNYAIKYSKSNRIIK